MVLVLSLWEQFRLVQLDFSIDDTGQQFEYQRYPAKWDQITLGYSNTAEYRHAIKTRHQSGSPTGNAIDFYTWLYGSATTAIGGQHVMSLDGANVGVGTTTPSAKLEVEPGSASGVKVRISNTNFF